MNSQKQDDDAHEQIARARTANNRQQKQAHNNLQHVLLWQLVATTELKNIRHDLHQ
jgi:hypothetical protein